MHRNHRLAKALSHQRLKLILNFRLLLLQIVWSKDGCLCLLHLGFFVRDILRYSWADCSWLELILYSLLVELHIRWHIVLVSDPCWNGRARVHVGTAAPHGETQTHRITRSSSTLAIGNIRVWSCTSPFDAGCGLVVFVIGVGKGASTGLFASVTAPIGLLLDAVGCAQSVIRCWRVASLLFTLSHAWYIHSFRKVASAESSVIYSLFAAHVLCWVHASLGKVNGISDHHVKAARLGVKVSLDRVEWVLGVVVKEVHRASFDCFSI